MATSQLIGSFIGVFISYLLAKYNRSKLYPEMIVISDGDLLYFDGPNGTPYYGRLLLNEFLATFTFVFVVLIIKFKNSLQKVENPIKGIGITLTLICCYSMTLRAGASLNPWFGLT
jgi:glycerol uptake facilitator-like aquaporin